MFQVPKTVDTSLNSNEHGIPEKWFWALIHQSCGQMVTIGSNRTILLSCSSSIITISIKSPILLLEHHHTSWFSHIFSSIFHCYHPCPIRFGYQVQVVQVLLRSSPLQPQAVRLDPLGMVEFLGIPLGLVDSLLVFWFSVGFLMVFFMFFHVFSAPKCQDMPGSRMTLSFGPRTAKAPATAPLAKDQCPRENLRPSWKWGSWDHLFIFISVICCSIFSCL
jgi:hypothetical protein